MNDHYYQTARRILETIHYGVVATASSDGQPWNSPVVMLPDTNLNLYWFSDAQAQHSRNLRANPRVYIVLFDSTVPVFSAHIDHGLYVQAHAQEVSEAAETEHAYVLLGRPTKHRPVTQRVYRATPERVWINDVEKQDGRFVRDTRHELDLDGLKAYLRQ